MKLYLIVAKGKRKGFPIEIKVDLFLIGSDRMCQLRSELPGIFPQHCAVVKKDERKVFVRDLDSGKTIINGDLLPPGEEWPLHAGDRIEVGPLEFLVQFHEKQLSQRDAEEWALKALDEDNDRMRSDEPELDDFGNPHVARPNESAASAAASILDILQAQKGIVKGRLRVAQIEGLTVIRFNDVYLVDESELALIRKELMDNLTRPNMRVLLDFKNVMRMSSNAAELIPDVHRHLRARAGSLAMCRLRPELRAILETLHVMEAIPHFVDKKVAMSARW